MFHSEDLNPDQLLPFTPHKHLYLWKKKTINVLTIFSIFYKSCVKIKWFINNFPKYIR